MEKKNTIILLSILGVMIIVIGIAIVLNGSISVNSNYVLLEVNPKVEFVVDKHNIVTSYNALNDEAKTLLVQENYIGTHIDKACESFLELCTKANFIDVESENNAIKVTILDGLTQALDVRVVENIHKYLKSHEILCAVIENTNDLNTYKEAKTSKISNVNKYKVIKHIIENGYSNESIESLSKLSEENLIKIITRNHPIDKGYTEAQLTNKVKLIDFNRERYDNHMNKITNTTQRKFSEEYDKYQKLKTKEYKENFDKMYEEWKLAKNV